VHLVQSAHSVLTPSELDVLCAAANGLTAGETAHSLVKGEATVKTQRRQILLKLGARNIAHAVCIATEDGIVRCSDRDEVHELLAAAVA
jgi:DNA-binding NarL/FixJ family response regulator